MFIGSKFLNEEFSLPQKLLANKREAVPIKRSLKKTYIIKTEPNQAIPAKNQQEIKIGHDVFGIRISEQSKEAGKLPLIRVKSLYSLTSIYKKYLSELENRNINPYLQKYIQFKSEQKQKQEDEHGFLNINSLKPFKRKGNKINHKEARLKILPRPVRQDTQLSNPSKHDAHRSQPSPPGLKNKNSRIQLQNGQSVQKDREDVVLKNISQKSVKNVLKIKRPAKPSQFNVYQQWCMFLTIIDGISLVKQASETQYKAYVAKGNNSTLIKSLIKGRAWWTLVANQSEANLYWTQSRKKKYLESLRQNKTQEMQYSTNKVKLRSSTEKSNFLSHKIKHLVRQGYYKITTDRQSELLFPSPSSTEINLPQINKYLHPSKSKIHNHLQFNWNLSNKKGLYYNLRAYYLAIGQNPFSVIPETYHVEKQGDQEWMKFMDSFNQRKSFWIIKPGQNSNRGCGIDVAETFQEIKEIIRNKSIRANGKKRSHIIQRYIMPLLYNRRKFDIRCYMLVTGLGGNLRCYWYQEGYVRTSSKEFTVKNLKNRMIHLTNDAVQKHSQDYGKHESGNKLSFSEIDKYIQSNHPQWDFYDTVYPKMMKSAEDAIKSSSSTLDSHSRQHSFELFGLDFMIDEAFNPWLLQINTNPCLELSSPLLSRLIPQMLENSIRIAIDPIFPPPRDSIKARSQFCLESNKYTLIFSARQQASNNVSSCGLLELMENEEELNDQISQDEQ